MDYILFHESLKLDKNKNKLGAAYKKYMKLIELFAYMESQTPHTLYLELLIF